MKNLWIPLLLIIASCSGEAENKDEIEAFSPKDDQTERIAADYPHKDFTKNMAVINEWKALRKKFKSVPFVTKTEAGNLYMFSQVKDFEFPNEQLGYIKPFDKIGLSDAKGKVLLPCEYDKIGNPGGIASGYMELCKDKKYGLYNYQTNTIIKPEFDFIFPSGVMGYVAIGKKGQHFYKIYDDGEILMIINDGEIPSYEKLGERGNFDIHNPATGLWIDTEFMIEYPANKEYMNEINNAMIFPPSYIVNLKVLPETIEGIQLDSYFGIETLVSKTEIVKPRNEETNSFLKYFYEMGSDGRGWEVESRQLVTIDKKSKVIDSKTITTKPTFGIPPKCDDGRYRAVTFLNDSLIEVKGNAFDVYKKYHYFSMTSYSYFQISASGKITQIGPDCYFPMASAIKLNENYLKGCFAETIEGMEYNDEGLNNTIMTSHLSLYDLEYMVNEIYARHGLIFKDPKWKSIFADKEWYKSKTKIANVDKMLTPLEKANIKFIKAFANKMKDNEAAFTRPEETIFHIYP